MKISSINRFFNIVLGAMAMLAVALISAFITMRLAIHGREVEVPNLAGLTIAEASQTASSQGLNLNVENRFYSNDVAPGHILAQSPTSGVTVRREWTVRVTESLGPQKVSVPDLIGQTERPASILMRRLTLDMGTAAQLPVDAETGIVLAQTPTPNASGIDRPRVSLLLSAPEDPDSTAYVMPSLTGLTLTNAAARAAAAGVHIASVEDVNLPAPTVPTAPAAPTTPTVPAASATPIAAAAVPATTAVQPGTVVDQSPQAGYRVVKGDAVHITLTH
ncbi:MULTISPECIES: PASTA domain-containing protein [Acidobacteriaceae]|uniref:PASTA domain-containing protein n=1 Tax=Acidobacteriaceae TaxID=204434 RepID=UPI00131B6CD4|nr:MULTISPECIES: PASTA domain-containing protein [Acidobacteriaceae]MDW5264218.1 PASTA domain-containing protein [Edaphobacter sp.]